MSKIPVTIFAEMTPNPNTMKFVANNYLIDPSATAEFKNQKETKGFSPMADELFNFPFVKEVYFANNFVSITKDDSLAWDYITTELRDYIRNYIADGKQVITKIPEEKPAIEVEDKTIDTSNYSPSELDDTIKALLDEYVKPIVEGDGGAIEFRNYKDGVVTVVLKGACNGCPSSTVTLKSGIEQILKQHIPEITDVVSE
ncbi:MAG TPA: NifU family protein [Brumimicrobium sp.]|nr:NifU family protein [Brumimicrobium sp.]